MSRFSADQAAKLILPLGACQTFELMVIQQPCAIWLPIP